MKQTIMLVAALIAAGWFFHDGHPFAAAWCVVLAFAVIA